MSRSVVYRERESDTREWDDQPRRTYTTVKRYQVPDSRSTVGEEETTTKEKITIRRERSAQPRERERDDENINIRITERDRGAGRGEDWGYSDRLNVSESTRDRGRESSYRVTERESDYEDRRSRAGLRSGNYRTSYVERDSREVGGDDRVREYTFERDRDFSPARHRRDDSYEVERYVKETDYYAPEQRAPPPIIIREKSREPPQPIIIQEAAPQPIIIREARREPRYEFVEENRDESKSVVKSVVKSEAPPSPAPSRHSTMPAQQQQQEEDYFYERRVIERERPPPPRSRANRDSYELHPKDSASNYSSDDSYTHVKKSTTYIEDRDHSPHHKLHLAEGALVGAAAGEVLRHHRMSQGKPAGGRVVPGVAGAAVGALGAEVVTRWRSRSRARRDESRSSSGSRHSRRSRRRRSYSRSRSRSRSRSKSRNRHLGAYAGVAALGALGAYALTRSRNKNQETVIINDGGGRRRRRSTRRSLSEDEMDRDVLEDDKHRDPQHRNRRIAQAGLASAAAAGIWERVRSKSRGGRHRSKSRLQQGVPIAAAGLGGAALAGLYEKNKANKEAKRDAIIQDELNRGRQPSRSRSRPGGRGYGYGNDPVYRDAPRDGYYSDEEPARYRRRGGSAGSSPDNRDRRRSRSRNAHAAEAAAAAGAAGVAAYEMGRNHERGTQHREYEEYGDPYHGHGSGYSPNPYQEPPSGYLPPGQGAYPDQQPQQPYPNSPYFPPPPTGNNAYATSPTQGTAYPAPYNPANYGPGDYGQTGAAPNAYGNTRDINTADARASAEHHENNHNGPGSPPPADQNRRGRGGDNNDVSVSNIEYTSREDQEREVQDAGTSVLLTPRPLLTPFSSPFEPVLTSRPPAGSSINASATPTAAPRARSTSRVRFNLDANESHSPEVTRRQAGRYSDSEVTDDRKRRHRRHRRRHGESRDLMNDAYDRPPSSRHGRHRNQEEDDDSDGTIELPDRFDEHGNRKGEGADALQNLLGSLAGRVFGGNGGGQEGEGRGRRHSHRH